MGKTAGIVLGIFLLVVGIVLLIYGFSSFLGSTPNPDSLNSYGIQNSFKSAGVGIFSVFFGFALIGAGGVIIYLVNIGKIFNYMAKETAPAVETTSHALGKGLASGVKKGLKNK
ncbi:MAG: hypothetical protein AABW51_04635 [Nanoarchaeota archaeon]